MEPANPSSIVSESPTAVQLSELFGSYKAEWLKEQLFDLFTEPEYFPELMTSRPCMLLGGRGTGKTTVLRSLSYEGQFALSHKNLASIQSANFHGIYYRVNTNRVTAFKGSDLDDATWTRLFAHYFNLLMCDLVLRFVHWYEDHTQVSINLDSGSYRNIADTLSIDRILSMSELAAEINSARLKFETYINNVTDADRPPLSIQGGPIDALIEGISQLDSFQNKTFFFLIDEYENFEDYQQRVVNTLIKHSGQLYTFKIGVRELGWRIRTTLNANEQLISPADYVRINIVEKLDGEKFGRFALSVCNERIARLRPANDEPIRDISEALEKLSEDVEAKLLGVDETVAPLMVKLRRARLPIEEEVVSPLLLLLIREWADKENVPVLTAYRDFLKRPEQWMTRYVNYKHVLLYVIRRRKPGIRKYYAGWDTFTQLAACNIRYLLELVDQSLLLHVGEERKLSDPVSPETQTKAAQKVGNKNLSELQGLSVHGAQLTKLLLGLGRVFGVMASDPIGHAPEITQFHLKENGKKDQDRVNKLLDAAVMHLALVRLTGSKPTDEADTRECDYMIHPIFAPFFVFSYRKKRKMRLSGGELLKLVEKPQEGISEILGKHKRKVVEPLPDQLSLFESYYGTDS